MPTVAEMKSLIQKLPSTESGLLWRPTTRHLDDADWFGTPLDGTGIAPPVHFSELDHSTLNSVLTRLNSMEYPPPQLVVEIGVDRSENFASSSTGTILKWKPKTCTYIGIDIVDKSHLNDIAKNIFTIQGDSANHQQLYSLMNILNIPEIDFMFVDGWHSINQVLTEWKYWERMKSNGTMMFHDINYHPGPIAVLEAADPIKFDVSYFGRDVLTDWGIGVVKRKVNFV